MTDECQVNQEIRPRGLDGISEDQIAQHWALYEGYVKNVNLLEEKIDLLSWKGEYGPEFAELKRRQGFEYNGMVLHEHYFAILKAGQPPLAESAELATALVKSFGTVEAWKKQFIAMGHMRGTGWVILYHDPRRGVLTNVWITSHENGHPAGLAPILVLDVWEHAYMVDAGADGRAGYIVKFLANVDWAKAEAGFQKSAQQSAVSGSTR